MVKLNFITKGEGHPIIFVHGLGESSESWLEQVEFFAAHGFKAIAVDLRGHGRSEAGNDRIEMGGIAGDLLEMMRSLQLNAAHFCGLSMGALVVLEVYKEEPSSFLSMTLVSSLPQYPPAQTQALENMSMKEIGDQIASAAVGPAASMELKKNIARVIATTNKRAYIESAETACAQDYTTLLPTIRVPVLLVSGELDYITPPESAMFMQKRIANARLESIKGVGHLTNREKPSEFNKLLLSFMSEVDGEVRN